MHFYKNKIFHSENILINNENRIAYFYIEEKK